MNEKDETIMISEENIQLVDELLEIITDHHKKSVKRKYSEFEI